MVRLMRQVAVGDRKAAIYLSIAAMTWAASSFWIIDWVAPFLDSEVAYGFARVAIIIGCVLVIKRNFPQALPRLMLPHFGKRFVIGVLITFLMTWPIFFHEGWKKDHLGNYFAAAGGTFLVGLAEEFLSRGLVFAIFEKYGRWIAVIISSTSFGALHLINWIDGQDLGLTIIQSFSAMGIGFLWVGVMIFTRSIWIPVASHALWDFPFLNNVESEPEKSIQIDPLAWYDLQNFLFESLPLIIVGCLLVAFSDGVPSWFSRLLPSWLRRNLKRLFGYLGLIER